MNINPGAVTSGSSGGGSGAPTDFDNLPPAAQQEFINKTSTTPGSPTPQEMQAAKNLYNSLTLAEQQTFVNAVTNNDQTTMDKLVNQTVAAQTAQTQAQSGISSSLGSGPPLTTPPNNPNLPGASQNAATNINLQNAATITPAAVTAAMSGVLVTNFGFSPEVVQVIMFIRENGPPGEITREAFDNAMINGELPSGITYEEITGEFGEQAWSLQSFLSDILRFTLGAKNVLQQLMLTSQGEMAQKYEMRLSTINEAQGTLEKVMEETRKMRADMAEQIRKAKEAGEKNFIVNVTMLVVSVVITVACAVATVCSAGAASPALVAAVGFIAACSAAVSVTDFATKGAISKEMASAFTTLIEKMVEAGCPESLAYITTALLVVLIVVILLIISQGLAAKAGTAAASMTTQAGAKEAIQGTVKMAINMTIVTLLTMSNAIGDSFTKLGQAWGMTKEEAEIFGMVVQAVLVIVVSMHIAKKGLGRIQSSAINDLKTAQASLSTAAGASKAIPKVLFGMQVIQSSMQVASSGMQAYQHKVQADFSEKQAEVIEDRLADLELQLEILREVVLKGMKLDEESLQAEMDKLISDISAMGDQFSKFIGSLQGMSGIFGALNG